MTPKNMTTPDLEALERESYRTEDPKHEDYPPMCGLCANEPHDDDCFAGRLLAALRESEGYRKCGDQACQQLVDRVNGKDFGDVEDYIATLERQLAEAATTPAPSQAGEGMMKATADPVREWAERFYSTGTPAASAKEMKDHIAGLGRQLVADVLRRVWQRHKFYTEGACDCGGGEPGDDDTCPACEIYHAMKMYRDELAREWKVEL